MNSPRSRITRFFFPAIIVVSVVFMINFYLRSEDGVEIGFLGGDYSAFFGTTIFFIGIVVVIQLMMRRGSRGRYDKMNAYIEAERAANLSRKRDIDGSLIVKTRFPLEACSDSPDGDETLLLKQEKARAASLATMMKTNLSNIELKHAFGPQNLDNVARFEANFNIYVQALQEWADELRNRGQHDAARAVLEEAVNIGADTKKIFMTLTELYREGGQKDKLDELLSKTQSPEFLSNDQVSKSKIQEYITEEQY